MVGVGSGRREESGGGAVWEMNAGYLIDVMELELELDGLGI